MKQYYTPDISEFYVGFEYELHKGYEDFINDEQDVIEMHNVFNEKVVEKGESLIWLQHLLERDDVYVRVKYLDEDDILSFGFSDLIYNDEESSLDSWNRYRYENNKWTIYVESSSWYNYPSKDGVWLRIGAPGMSNWRYNGKIKNKSELGKILKMIGWEH